jgi:hypothetical protein
MKKIGEYTVRGEGPDNAITRIKLFDGRFDTAYRVVKFVIAGVDITSTSTTDVNGCLGTTFEAPSASWNWGDNRQIGWASLRGIEAAAVGDPFNLIDKDNLVVEDLFLYLNGNGSATVNYYIEMEKYDITDWQGALAMVRNSAQNVG